MLAEAARALPPDLRLHAWDCARPRHVQAAMWKIVEGTPQQPYVANPAAGSIHNFGCAVDLTLASADGTPLDMGTPFDHFGPEAEPRREAEMLKAGRLTPGQVAHRHVLRDAMVKAGFRPLGNEWWHFDCAAPAQVRKSYPILP
jgi:D-alanyl-D-alanine dipeptidase